MINKKRHTSFVGIRINRELTSRFKHTFLWIFYTCTVSFTFSFLIFLAERDVNQELDSFKEMLWWWVLALNGVNYIEGNYPITVEGKIFMIFVFFTSLFLLALVISEVAELIRLTYERKERGIIRIGYKKHIVIYGYSSLTAGVIKLLRSHFGPSLKIVLISNDTDFNPFPGEVDFIYANPIDRDTFIESNAEEAIASIILANDRFAQPDAYSLVIATGVEMYNSKSVTIVELMDESYKELYKEGKIEAFINRKELLRDLLQKSQDSKLVRIIEKETGLQSDLNDEKVELI